MRYIVLDIETVPLDIKDPHIVQYLMDKNISKERRVLDPNYSKIIAVGLKQESKDPEIIIGEDETKILKELWDNLANYMKQPTTSKKRIVTHNGYKFDIPFIIVRSYVNHIKPKVEINTNRWRMGESNHFDTMLFFSQYELFTNLSLKILCRMHDIEVPEEGISGADIEERYKKGNWDIIKEHCKQDVEITAKLYEKIFLEL